MLIQSDLTENISIHAPAKGATAAAETTLLNPFNFNPRSREGSDLHPLPANKGIVYFNPRSREGSDSEADYTQNEDYVFQSTLPRRERHARSLIPCLHHLISIHAPAKGATGQQRLSAPETCISIHAPAKGATQLEAYSNADEAISIHAPAKGATISGNRK